MTNTSPGVDGLYENDNLNRQSFWHPMTHPGDMKYKEPVCISSGNGVFVQDVKGNNLLDAGAGLWCVNVGHNRSKIKNAINAQLEQLEFFQLFSGMSHPRAVEFSNILINSTSEEDMKRVVFSSGGSDAIETALKLSRQYHRLNGQPERTKFLSLRHGYHGTHIGGTSINGDPVFRRNYEPLLPGCFQITPPWLYRNPWTDDPEELGRLCAVELENEILYHSPDTISAFIAEPVLGVGGVIVPPANYWPLVRQVCDKYGVLLVADEVITGFGRTGSKFGSRAWGVKPYILCLAKGISSGYIPLGATLVNSRIAEVFETNQGSEGSIMHGYTYGGHPVACAAGIATLQIVEDENLVSNARIQGDYLMSLLKPLEERFSSVGEVRGKGLMIAIELVADKVTREPIDLKSGITVEIATAARHAGVLVRPVGNKIILSPPLTFQREHCEQTAEVMKEACSKVFEND